MTLSLSAATVSAAPAKDACGSVNRLRKNRVPGVALVADSPETQIQLAFSSGNGGAAGRVSVIQRAVQSAGDSKPTVHSPGAAQADARPSLSHARRLQNTRSLDASFLPS